MEKAKLVWKVHRVRPQDKEKRLRQGMKRTERTGNAAAD
jgi:hypothetical protein